jgi:hypothetical protein
MKNVIALFFFITLSSVSAQVKFQQKNNKRVKLDNVNILPLKNIFNKKLCSGDGTGTTTLGCPNVDAGGLGLNGIDLPNVACGSSGCVDIEANYLDLGDTSTYRVESIPYLPPYQFNCLTTAVSVNDDDVWSPEVNLPFNFCYYGNTYNKCFISSNGVMTFDTTNNSSGGYSGYQIENNIPDPGSSSSSDLPLNSIFGVFTDINPIGGGEVGYEIITLNTGCRALVIAWHDVPMYDADNFPANWDISKLLTSMIVLYENTNVIEVYVENRDVKAVWNDGNAIIGLHNEDGTLATVPPGRNGLDTDWTVTNEAWRFVPDGTSITDIKWYEGTTTSGPVLSTMSTLNVCPTTTTNYTAEVSYTLCNGSTIKETDTTTITFDSCGSTTIDFDGNDDYANRSSLVQNFNECSMMGWVKTDEIREADLFGQNSFRVFTNGSGQVSAQVRTGSTVTTTASVTTMLPVNKWIHVAAIYNGIGDTLTLYLNGEQITQSITIGNTLDSDSNDFEIGRRSNGADRYFKGDMQEVRVYDVALTAVQLQEQVYQKIEDNGGHVNGSTVNKDIDNGSLNWSDLILYLELNPSSVIGGATLDASDSGNNLTVNNMTTSQSLGAPVPYTSITSGVWTNNATWTNGTEWDITNLPNKDWAIVRLANNSKVTTTASHTHFGLVVDSGSELEIQNNQLLTNTSYLKLDGLIDLVGESQLIQTLNSDLDIVSSGLLERDQQGTQDLYTYNYWASPVGISNTISNNNSYTVSDILKDGTNPNNVIDINFITNSYDGTSGTPIGIADYWIWKYGNLVSDYYNWEHVRSNGILQAGEGFTMKGVSNTNGNVTLEQNYVLKGKPNNGSITLPISGGNEYLVGNPYASAIDANEFIANNTNTTGALYFWEHWGGSSHNTSQYQGGYAVYNLSGATPAMQYDFATGGNTGTSGANKLPGRYVPVAQGFFVTGVSTGSIIFNNGQRVFEKEGVNSVFIKSNQLNANTSTVTDDRMKIRLGLNSLSGYKRQILVTVDNNATPQIDFGYDALNPETQIDDMYWMIDSDKFVIQGIDNIDINSILPLGVLTNTDGNLSFKIDELINVPNSLNIYIYDTLENTYHDIKNNPDFTINLDAGEYLNRFELRFNNTTLSTEEFNEEAIIEYYFENNNEAIIINNPKLYNIESVELFNVLGQSIIRFENIKTQNHVELKTNGFSTGNYVLEIKTDIGKLSNKVLIE